MKSRQTWMTVGTAVVSFALGLAVAPSVRKPETGAATEARRATSGSNAPSGELPEEPADSSTRTRAGRRDDRKQAPVPRISIPLTTVSDVIRQQQYGTGFGSLRYGLEKALPLIGATDQEKTEVMDFLKQLEGKTHAEEKNHLKVIQTDQTQIRLDNSSMAAFSKTVSQEAQDGLRARLPQDLAEVLVSAIDWEKLYPTGEQSFPTFTITRKSSGKMMSWVHESSGGMGSEVDAKFADDGTPIPVDQLSYDDRWMPFLKGLTLLPQNEK